MSSLSRWVERVPGLRGLRPGSLRLNVVWTLAGTIVQFGSQWVGLMVLAKLGSVQIVGRYSFATGLCAPVIATASLGLRNVLVTDARREFTYSDYLGLRVAALGVGMAVMAVLAAFTAPTPAMFLTYMLLAASRGVDLLSDIHWAQLQRVERMDLIAISQASRGLLGLGVLTLALAVTGSLAWGAAGLLAASLAVWWFFDVPAVRRVTHDEPVAPRFDRASIEKILHVVAPLVGMLVLTTVAGPMPRYFLEAYRDSSEVGFFAVASSPLAIVSFLPAAVYQATTSRAAQHLQHDEHSQFLALSLRVMAINLATSGVFCVASVLFGDHFLRLCYKPEYLRVWPEMNLFCLAQLLQSFATLGAQVLNAGRMFRFQALNSVFSVCVLLIASFALVPAWGVRGTAWADVIYKGVSTLAIGSVGVWYLLRRRRGLGVL
jgi:O-antigen/teichoic acid export membrane protein